MFSVYSIIERHGGWITVDSKVKKGSTFTFYLRAVADAVIPSYSERTKIVKGTGHILVMDDDESIRKALQRLLEEFGYQVESAAEGKTAVKLFRKALTAGKPFKAAILDLTIPGGMGGVETLERLRKIDPEIRSIVTSGHANAPVIAQYKEYGFRGRLAKPFQVEELSIVLNEVISG